MNDYKQVLGFCLVAVLSVPFVPSVRAGDSICLDAAAPAAIEAPVEAAAVTNAPADIREKLAKGVAGEKCLLIAQGKGYPPQVTTGLATYRFTVDQEGDYILWCRAWWLDECGNSFSINLDDAKPFIFGEDSTFKTWHWVKAPARLKQLTLGKGPHTLTIRIREDGVALNQILLTLDKGYVPVAIESLTPVSAP